MSALAGVHEVSELLGWSKQRLYARKSRGRFVAPVAILQMGPIWLVSDVLQWVRALPTTDPLYDELQHLKPSPSADTSCADERGVGE